MQVLEIFVTILLAQFLSGNGRESAVKVINAVDEIFGEARDGEVAGYGNFAFGAFLEVTEVGD